MWSPQILPEFFFKLPSQPAAHTYTLHFVPAPTFLGPRVKFLCYDKTFRRNDGNQRGQNVSWCRLLGSGLSDE